jgi:predicted ArsR family transcriptional regulator
MDLPPLPPDDVLATPARARLFQALAALRRPATTAELAERTGRHPNTTRVQLNELAEAGLIESRTVRRPMGRPRHEWVIAPGAHPGGERPQAHRQLSAWLARALRDPDEVEAVGRGIGHELAPEHAGRPLDDAMQDALTALGFAPRRRAPSRARVDYVLGNCPYRDAVAQNPAVVCRLHQGITRGLLDRLEPGAALVEFVAEDPYAAGCLIAIAPAPRPGE